MWKIRKSPKMKKSGYSPTAKNLMREKKIKQRSDGQWVELVEKTKK